jgi:exopolysaccharide production protein ExoY
MPEKQTQELRSVKRQASSTLRTPSGVPRDNQRRILAVGAAADIPRALQHPAVASGELAVKAAFAIEVEHNVAAELSAQLSKLIREHNVDAMLLAGSVGHTAMRVIADLSLLHHCELLAVMPTEVFAEHDPIVVWTGDSPVVQLTRIPKRRWSLNFKRALDVVGAGVTLTLTAPLIAVLAALVCLESPGSPIFAHRRVGRRGCSFNCLKLRTMRMGAEELLRADPELYEEYRRNHFKLPEDRDPRTTRVGQFLRKTSLDELPQLWNVLTGDMSLVGPRPVIDEELEMYEHASDLLLSVRPGLTGAWAVNGRHDVGYPDRCEIELSYVRNWRLSDDIRIMAKTVSVLVFDALGRRSVPL